MAQSSQHSSEDDKLKRDVKEKGQQIAQGISDTVGNAVGMAADKAREAQQGVNEVAGNMRSAVDSSLKNQPITTLAIAAGVGFVLGALWKS